MPIEYCYSVELRSFKAAWSKGLLVGFVVVFCDKYCGFVELMLSEIAPHLDRRWIVRQRLCCVRVFSVSLM